MLLGATGSGKSTLLRVLAGLLQLESGEVTCDGRRIESMADARGRVGMVFQSPESQLFADSVLEDVAFGPRNLGYDIPQSHRHATAALSAVGLDPDVYGSRSPFRLSGGEARRAALAGVLALEPEYLLLDEPTAGLDAEGRRALVGCVRDSLSRAGVIIVTHDVEPLFELASRIVVLEAGCVVLDTSTKQVAADPTALIESGASAPSVLRVQHGVRSCGIPVDEYSLDPVRAAALLLAAVSDR